MFVCCDHGTRAGKSFNPPPQPQVDYGPVRNDPGEGGCSGGAHAARTRPIERRTAKDTAWTHDTSRENSKRPDCLPREDVTYSYETDIVIVTETHFDTTMGPVMDHKIVATNRPGLLWVIFATRLMVIVRVT